ncbi:TPA: O63 family O-antigen polymerase, partial [Escherichia coli]|nr:O63 family O-antigen polymerase [Escherichia coli]
ELFYLVLLTLYSISFLFPIYFFRNRRKDLVSKYIYGFFSSINTSHYVTRIFILLYFIILIPLIYVKGFSLFTSTNRFEDNSGIGGLARFYDIIWLFVAGSFILYYKRILLYGGTIRKTILFFPFLAFFILNMLVIGSKSELVQYVLFYYLIISAYGYKFKLSIAKLTILGGLSLCFALIVLFFNFKMEGDGDFSNIINESFLRLLDRIMSNGDMYYLGLPHNVIEKIKTNNVLIDFFAPVLSSKLISHLAGYDVYTYDIGKQILLFHYPFYDIAGGPVEHFDLFGYKHFGIIGGIMFSAFLGMGVVILRNLVFLSRGNVFMTIVTCSIYFKMLAVILKPSILFAFMFDFLSVYISVGVISILLVGKRS